MYLFGNLDGLPNGIMSDAEVPVMQHIKDSDPIQPQLGVVDLNTDPAFFHNQIMFTVRAQVGRRGILQVNFDYAGDVVPAMALAMQHERLSEGRNRQKPFARVIEKGSSWRATAVAKNMGHHNASAMAEPKEVFDKFVLGIPELNRVEEPKAFIELKNWELQRGLTTDAAIMQSRDPDLTIDEAQAEVLVNLNRQAETNEIKSRSNMSGNDPMETAAQANGREGGLSNSGGAEAPGVNDDDGSNGNGNSGGGPSGDAGTS